MEQNMNIYILKQENNKYYIGKSKNVNNRILDHFINSGAAWTRKYKPISVEAIYQMNSIFDEDNYTKQYMLKYGIDNVRGGSYVQVILPEETKKMLQKELYGLKDLCYNCGLPGHFIKDCKKNKISDSLQECKGAQPPYVLDNLQDRLRSDNTLYCDKCGRNSHNKNKCYAKKDINGNIISDHIREKDGMVDIKLSEEKDLKRERLIALHPEPTITATIVLPTVSTNVGSPVLTDVSRNTNLQLSTDVSTKLNSPALTNISTNTISQPPAITTNTEYTVISSTTYQSSIPKNYSLNKYNIITRFSKKCYIKNVNHNYFLKTENGNINVAREPEEWL